MKIAVLNLKFNIYIRTKNYIILTQSMDTDMYPTWKHF